MKKILSLCLILLIIFMSCNKDQDEINFEGITSRDEQGVLIYNDPDDWRLNDTWVAAESSLFSDNQNINCENDFESYSIKASPNPCKDFIIINKTNPINSQFSLRIVDQDFNLLFSNDSLNNASYRIDINGLNRSNQVIRLYYKFHGEACVYKGHGDIEIE